MSKIVDNLLGKLDQLKRKVMEDNETGGAKPVETPATPEMKEGKSANPCGCCRAGERGA